MPHDPHRRTWRALLLTALIAVAWPAMAEGAETLRIEPTRFPHLPELTVNERPALCEPYLAAYRAWYKSSRTEFKDEEIWTDGAAGRILGLEEVKWVQRPIGPESKFTFSSVDWDVDGDGDLELILSHEGPRAGDDYNEIMVLDDREEFLTKAAAASYGEYRELVGELSDIRGTVVAEGYYYYPTLVSFGDEIMLYGGFSKINLSAKPTPICRLSSLSLPLGGIHVRRSKGGFSEFPALTRYLRRLADVLGNPTYQCEGRISARMDGRRRGQAVSRLYRDMSRPQTLSIEVQSEENTPKQPSPHASPRFWWSNYGFFEYQTSRAVEEEKVAAIAELAAWYRHGFGLPEDVATTVARAVTPSLAVVLNERSSSGAEFGLGEPHPSWDWRAGLQQLENGETIEEGVLHGFFRRALLDGAGPDEVAQLMDAGAYDTAMRIFEKHFANGQGFPETPIFLALEHPQLVELLLDRGEDPNRRNYFGKTPLMYAAQFNLIETAELLLRRGADANLRTTQKPDSSCHKLRYTGRTALMYAAENADQRMMALLILSGSADTKARDQENLGTAPKSKRRISDYLARNENLSHAQRATIIKRWGLE